MGHPDKALQTQLANIETRTGKSIAQLQALLAKSGLQKHGELVAHLKADLGMGHGDANVVVHCWKQAGTAPAGDPLDAIYSGSKAPLRALHEAVLARIAKFGPFEIAPKKANVSLRRKKQFALLGPGSKGRLEIGMNMRDVRATARLVEEPAGRMCQYKVFVTTLAEIDAELLGWMRTAFDAAG
jgi:hypothetical protein